MKVNLFSKYICIISLYTFYVFLFFFFFLNFFLLASCRVEIETGSEGRYVSALSKSLAARHANQRCDLIRSEASPCTAYEPLLWPRTLKHHSHVRRHKQVPRARDALSRQSLKMLHKCYISILNNCIIFTYKIFLINCLFKQLQTIKMKLPFNFDFAKSTLLRKVIEIN